MFQKTIAVFAFLATFLAIEATHCFAQKNLVITQISVRGKKILIPQPHHEYVPSRHRLSKTFRRFQQGGTSNKHEIYVSPDLSQAEADKHGIGRYFCLQSYSYDFSNENFQKEKNLFKRKAGEDANKRIVFETKHSFVDSELNRNKRPWQVSAHGTCWIDGKAVIVSVSSRYHSSSDREWVETQATKWVKSILDANK